MRYFFKEAKKDKYGVERNLLLRSGKVALIDTIPVPFLGQMLEPESKLVKKHPVMAVIGGQAGVLGAVDRNIGSKKKRYFNTVMATAAAGGAASAVPAALVGKWVGAKAEAYYKTLNPRKRNYIFDLAKNQSKSFIGKRINNYLQLSKGSFPKVVGKWGLITLPAALLTAPLKYAVGYTFGKKIKPEKYTK